MVAFVICAVVAMAFGAGYAYGHLEGQEKGVAEGRRQVRAEVNWNAAHQK